MAWMPGTDGPDTITAFGDYNTLFGGSEGNPRGDRGPNTLIVAGGSHNTMVGSVAVDSFDGGSGIDNTVSYQLSTVRVVASLANPSINTGDAAGDTYRNVYQLTGSPLGGALYGDTSGRSNQLWALGGSNDLYGATGYTTFISGPGADRMFGGVGRGLVDYETSKSAVTASLRDPSINTGEAAGDTYSNIWDLAGSPFSDILHGNDQANNFLGGHSDDRGNDTFYGYGGSDTFRGGRGADVMFGGSGGDLFVFEASDREDARAGLLNRIGDYNLGNSGSPDRNEFDGIDLKDLGLSVSDVRVLADNGFSILQINDGGTWRSMVRLDGVNGGDGVRVITDGNAFGTWLTVSGGSSSGGTADLGSHGGSGWPVSGIGDFNGDGTADILWRSPSTGRVDQWQLKNGGWSQSIDLGATKGAQWQVVGIGDFDGDRTDDVMWRDANSAKVDQWHMKNGNWAGSIDHGATKGTDWTTAGVGDFNGDGTDDVLWRRTGSSQVDQWQMKNGNWSRSIDLGATKGADWQVAGIGDFNGDGTDDILWRKTDTSQVDQWEMRNGNWSRSIDLGATKDSNWQVAGIGDFNGDKTDDIFWHNQATGQSEYWTMKNGNWAGSVDKGTQATSTIGAGAGDINGNGTDEALLYNRADDHLLWLV